MESIKVKKFTLLSISAVFFLIFLPISLSVLALSAGCYWAGKGFDVDKLTRYGFYLAFAYDQFANTAVFLGSPEETISSRLARAMASGRPRWFVPAFAELVDWLALVVSGEKDHVENSLEEGEQVSKELVSWIKGD